MFYEERVEIPQDPAIVFEKSGEETFVYFSGEEDREVIGKVCPDNPFRMYPNGSFFQHFPDWEVLEEEPSLYACAFLVIKRIMEVQGVDRMLKSSYGEMGKEIQDLAACSLLKENRSRYFKEYVKVHPVFSPESRKGGFDFSRIPTPVLEECTDEFLTLWNASRDHSEKIAFRLFSARENGKGTRPLFAVAFESESGDPCFYETFPRVEKWKDLLGILLNRAHERGFTNVEFVLDEKFFSETAIRCLDQTGHDFVIPAQGEGKVLRSVILENRESFQKLDDDTLELTLERKILEGDEKSRYFYLFCDRKEKEENDRLLTGTLGRMDRKLEKACGTPYTLNPTQKSYYDAVYREGQILESVTRKTGVIREKADLFGTFGLISSREMTLVEALSTYRRLKKREGFFIMGRSEEKREERVLSEFLAMAVRNTILKKMGGSPWPVRRYLLVLDLIRTVPLPDGTYGLPDKLIGEQREILNVLFPGWKSCLKEAEEQTTGKL